ncbi:MAG: type II secretion system F family protein [Candidatus Kaelpia aquatica]|nr:type II secretion system F family protein [Candidatus Kaelpia aquatica]
MAIYNYLARNKNGEAVKGKVTVTGESELMQFFKERDLLPISFDKVEAATTSVKRDNRFSIFKNRVNKRDLIAFTLQFSTTIKAGIPIVNALRFLVEETQDKFFQAVLSEVIVKVEQGVPLSKAMASFSDVFPKIYTEMIASGEVAGTLDEILSNLAKTMERDYNISVEVKNALRYPVLVFTGIISAIFCISLFVIPRFARVYGQFDVELPLPTRILLGTSGFLINNIVFLVVFTLASVIGFNYWRKTSRGSFLWGKIKLRIPIFGEIFLKVSLLRFCFIFNALNSVGIPILKALEIVSKTLGNDFLQNQIEGFGKGVSEGQALSVLMKESKAFPKLVGNMIGVGEQTGAMDIVLESLSSYYHMELKSKIDALTVTIEPVLTAFLAVGVLILAMGVFLPMWNMTQLFKT